MAFKNREINNKVVTKFLYAENSSDSLHRTRNKMFSIIFKTVHVCQLKVFCGQFLVETHNNIAYSITFWILLIKYGINIVISENSGNYKLS